MGSRKTGIQSRGNGQKSKVPRVDTTLGRARIFHTIDSTLGHVSTVSLPFCPFLLCFQSLDALEPPQGTNERTVGRMPRTFDLNWTHTIALPFLGLISIRTLGAGYEYRSDRDCSPCSGLDIGVME